MDPTRLSMIGLWDRLDDFSFAETIRASSVVFNHLFDSVYGKRAFSLRRNGYVCGNVGHRDRYGILRLPWLKSPSEILRFWLYVAALFLSHQSVRRLRVVEQDPVSPA